MNKLKLGSASLAAAIGTAVLAWAASANATGTISLEIFDGAAVPANLIASVSNVSGGFATVAGSDANFSSVSVTAHGVPVIPSPDFGTLTIDAQSASGNHSLTILATQQGLTDFPSGILASSFAAYYLLNSQNVSSVQISNFIDAGNGAFAMTTPIGSHTFIGGVNGSFGPLLTAVSGLGTFSETEQFVLNFTGVADVQGNSQIYAAVPEPSTLAMTLLGFVGLGFAFRQSRRKISFA
jgi:hypothetical protein